ncbi:MAG TPA: hypothetical protein VFR70_05495, partial [Flavobacterium sp.]|nr:hypothetical protein [Flavobacterium sp.]
KEIKAIEKISVRTSQLVYPFYAKFGLELKETIKDYWGAGFDLYRLEADAGLVKNQINQINAGGGSSSCGCGGD